MCQLTLALVMQPCSLRTRVSYQLCGLLSNIRVGRSTDWLTFTCLNVPMLIRGTALVRMVSLPMVHQVEHWSVGYWWWWWCTNNMAHTILLVTPFALCVCLGYALGCLCLICAPIKVASIWVQRARHFQTVCSWIISRPSSALACSTATACHATVCVG